MSIILCMCLCDFFGYIDAIILHVALHNLPGSQYGCTREAYIHLHNNSCMHVYTYISVYIVTEGGYNYYTRSIYSCCMCVKLEDQQLPTPMLATNSSLENGQKSIHPEKRQLHSLMSKLDR